MSKAKATDDDHHQLVRLSMSIEKPLFEQFERLVEQHGYANRSEFIRDLIREQLVHQDWEAGRRDMIGTITILYDHHTYQLSKKLTDIQHDKHEMFLATTHLHLTHELCAEMIMVRGKPERIREMADRLRQQKGVLHAALSISSMGDGLH